jgi:8-oxoguanine deaminase
MARTFVKNILLLVTMDTTRQEIANGAMIIRDNVIEAVGTTDGLLGQADGVDETLDLAGHVVIPGLVNTHHHMFQSLTRVVPGGQNHELFDWLRSLYRMWQGLTPAMIYTSTQTAMAELILSGCTTASDHLYVYPNGIRLDDSIEAAIDIGMRFHPTRGSMSVGESKGGLPPDDMVEDEPAILKESQRLIETYHDARSLAMVRVGVAPCSPFTVSQDLMREAAALARAYGVRLHTHLAETMNDVAYSLEKFGMEPAHYAEDVGWLGDDVWHAHCVCLTDIGIQMFARTGTGVAHCPSSNMRLASGIAPVRQMRDAGVNVGLGVDGSASNDAGHMLMEARMCMLLHRIYGELGKHNPASMSAREALEIGTRGGAAVLGREDIGHLAPGMAADWAAFDMNHIAYAGAMHDPLAALIFCHPAHAAHVMINGRMVVKQHRLLTADLPILIQRHNAFAQILANR